MSQWRKSCVNVCTVREYTDAPKYKRMNLIFFKIFS